MERKTIIFQWLGTGVKREVTLAIKKYDFRSTNFRWEWLKEGKRVRGIERDIIIPVPGKDRRICRVGDFIIINPDGTYFQDLTYLQKYE